MVAVEDDRAEIRPRLLVLIGRKLRGRFSVSADRLLSLGLRSGLLIFYVLTIYVVVLALGGIDPQHLSVPWWLNVPALLIIVPTFLPIHTWLRRNVNQLVYGQHDNPYALLAHLNQHMSENSTPDAVLPALTATLAATLKLPYVAIETEGAEARPAVTFGVPPPDTEIVSIPLAYRTTILGRLHVSARHPHAALSPDDTLLLIDLARQVGITLHAAQLTDALQSSREQLVLAREEERRRIRRDLHDDLAPTLVGMRMQLRALHRLLPEQPDQATGVIADLVGDVQRATVAIRRLVYDLRPPMLDEHGLVGAIRNLSLVADAVTLTVDVPVVLPPLSAALEVALYRIATEAVHNVAKHAHATTCTIQIDVTEAAAVLCVQDDGIGVPAHVLPGVGLAAMRERAAELGGTVTIAAPIGKGTRVTATIPRRD